MYYIYIIIYIYICGGAWFWHVSQATKLSSLLIIHEAYSIKFQFNKQHVTRLHVHIITVALM